MYVLVINLGLKSVRAIVFNDQGEKVSAASLPMETTVYDKIVEQNPEEWWAKTCQVVKQATLPGSYRDGIKAVTVTTSASCLTCVDRAGKPLLNAIMVSDSRSQEEAARLEEVPSFAPVRTDTGVKASSDLTLPKIMWVQRHRPEVFEKTYKFLMPADFLVHRLTGEFATDHNNALKHHLSPRTFDLPERLLQEIGIPLDKFAKSYAPGTRVGHVSARLAEEFGLRPNTPVLLSTYDALCAVVGSGVTSVGIGSDVSGTVTSVRVLSDRPVFDAKQRIFCTPWLEAGGGCYLAGGSNNLGGGIIEWGKQLLLPEHAGDPYDTMVAEASAVPPGANGLVFLPYLLGERSPVWNPDARGVFFGLDRGHTRHELFRAILESAGYATRHLYEVIQSLGIRVDELRLSGGLARLPIMAQMKADMLGRPVKVVAEFETTALGAAMIVLRSQRHFASLAESGAAMVRISEICDPDPTNHRIYTEFFEIYKDLYTSLRAMFQERARVMASLHYRMVIGDRARKENL